MRLAEIKQHFQQCKSWEERYRLLIQFSKKLPKFSDDEQSLVPEIHGCESHLWFEFDATSRRVKAYSDARLMQGILFIIVCVLEEASEQELATLSLQALFDELHIARHLTSTRLNGIAQIESRVKASLGTR